MGEIFGLATLILVVLLIVLLRRRPADLGRGVRDELAASRAEAAAQARLAREELTGQFGALAGMQRDGLEALARRLAELTRSNEHRLEVLRAAVDERLRGVQEESARKLEEIRRTVDDKLHATLERRLGESFRLVSERLELVHRGLGEVQSLASGVGDLKRVLTNVKTRGTWGEIQLGALLDQVLTPEQYGVNVATRPGSNERVEFAIRLPGRDDAAGEVVWLPVDAKFPQEDYQRLVEASERGDVVALEAAAGRLDARILASAREIGDKYLAPPATTDFAVMFLPTEGLYAEVLRRPGLVERLQREHRVVVAGPTTLTALLNSLQMGFRTLAIQRRSSEVWKVLAAVKAELGRFGEVLDKVQKKLQEASSTIDSASTRSRAIERKLRGVEELPAPEAQALLGEG